MFLWGDVEGERSFGPSAYPSGKPCLHSSRMVRVTSVVVAMMMPAMIPVLSSVMFCQFMVSMAFVCTLGRGVLCGSGNNQA